MNKILLTGGGTLGSVTPLLAVAAKLKEKQPGVEFLWLGTRYGPEKEVVERTGIKLRRIYSGKLRRYFDWRNFIDPIRFAFGFAQSLFFLYQFRPQVIVGAGGFVQVPVVMAGKFLRIPIFVHQQDVRPSLSNLIVARFANTITTSFEESLKYFKKRKPVLVGNPARPGMLEGDHEIAEKMFHLEQNLPTILVLGGGTGATRLNRLIWDALPIFGDRVQIIHSIGKRKLEVNRKDALHYHHYEFLGDELAHAYAAADLVVSRAGMGTLTELAARGMPTILVPISNTHQVDNAKYFESRGAALFFDEHQTSGKLAKLVIDTLRNSELRARLAVSIKFLYRTDAADRLAELILQIAQRV